MITRTTLPGRAFRTIVFVPVFIVLVTVLALLDAFDRVKKECIEASAILCALWSV